MIAVSLNSSYFTVEKRGERDAVCGEGPGARPGLLQAVHLDSAPPPPLLRGTEITTPKECQQLITFL